MNDKKDSEKNAPYFTLKRKGKAAVISLGAAVLWVILWFIFPMEFYSLFFASKFGSTFLLAAMAAVLTFPACFICTKALSKDISVPLYLSVNIVGMVGCIFLYSIFRYSAVWWLILGLAVHLGATAAVFVTAPDIKVNRVKEKKGRLASALAGIVCAVCSDCIYLLLFNVLLETFREN
ncbi:MAG: hypothetical protein ACI4J0_05900 [Huintestinicola sp.]|uniref:hypothetical protein n=1 Tax=Huintestinicola sp. TaxID=2981661 RepID=UPI003F066037